MILFREVGSLRFGSNKSLLFFGKVCTFYSRTDRLLSNFKGKGAWIRWGGGGGGGRGGREGGGVSPYSYTSVSVTDQKLWQLACLFCCPDSALH